MATITITPGNTFNPTEPVTSTKLNDLGSPTAALNAASIGTADIADDAITSALIADDAITPALIADDAVTTPAILDANVTFAKLTDVIDDDTMATATDTTLATSESIKAYVDGGGGFTPSTYAGEESVTLPNGLIMKFGVATGSASQTAIIITFADAFPNGIISAQATATNTSAGTGATYDYWYQIVNQSLNTSVSIIAQAANSSPPAHNVNWMVIGY